MTDITANLQLIQIEETQYRSAVSESTMTKIGGSINSLVKNGPEALGTIIQSILTEAQFQSIRGAGWVLMSGQDITGSDLEVLTSNSILPDMVGNRAFLRQSSGALDVGDYQPNQNLSHGHNVMSHWSGGTLSGGASNSTIGTGVSTVNSGGDLYPMSGGSPNYITNATNSGTTDVPMVQYSGGSESRPNNYSISFFIKINL